MYTNAQNQQIMRILVKALDLNSFVTNQYLISRLSPQGHYYALLMSDFLPFPEFITMQVTEDDIYESIQQLQGFVSIERYLYIPYRIYPQMLVLKEFCQFASPDEILSYITSLHGDNPIAVHKMTDNIVITFKSIEDCIAFWRGTKYYPFRGTRYIECQIFSQDLENYPISILQEENNSSVNQTNQTETIEQQGNLTNADQYNDNYQSNQNYQQKKSPRGQNFRYPSKQKQFNNDGNSPRQSQNQRGNKSKDQQHRQQPQNFLRSNPKQQPNPPVQYRYKPQVQTRSSSQQPLVLQKTPKPAQTQFKSQQQPQFTQSQQSPQMYNRNHRQNQQQQQQQINHNQQPAQPQNQQQQEQQEPPPPQQQEQQPQQQQQQANTPKSSKSKKYYRPNSKKQNQKK